MSILVWSPKDKSTRELRANNLFGLSTCSYSRLWGSISEDNAKGDHLAIFPKLENSIHAAIQLIKERKLFLGMMFRPAALGNDWSRDPLKKYGFKLAKLAGLNPMFPYNFWGYGDPFLRAMAIMENGDPCRDIPLGTFRPFLKEVF